MQLNEEQLDLWHEEEEDAFNRVTQPLVKQEPVSISGSGKENNLGNPNVSAAGPQAAKLASSAPSSREDHCVKSVDSQSSTCYCNSYLCNSSSLAMVIWPLVMLLPVIARLCQ